MKNMSYSYKEIGKIAFPVLFSLLMEHVIGMTDTAFLGRVGEVELGAAALASVFYLAVFMLGFGFSIGAQVLIARRNGEQKYRDIGPIFYSSSIFLLLLAAVLFVLSYFFAPTILKPLIQSEGVRVAAEEYLNWRIYGLFFVFLCAMFRAFFVGTTRTGILTINAIVMVLANVGLNYALIFGKFGFPELGIAGAAIASSVSECVSLLFYVVYSVFKVDFSQYGLEKFHFLQWRLLGRILDVSVWTMLQSFLAVGVWFFFFVAVEHLGERTLAVINLVRTLSMIPFILLNSFATTASSLVSNLIGEGQVQDVMKLGWKIIFMALWVVVPVLALYYLFPYQTLRLYTDNRELIAATRPVLWVMGIGSLLQIPANIWFNVVSGTGNTRTALVIECVTLLIYFLTVIVVVVVGKGSPAVCWSTEIYYQLVMLIFCYWYMRRGRWRERRI